MSDYTKLTNYAVKDGYTTGNPAKVIKGTEIDDEFNAIATAVATKYDSTDLTDIKNSIGSSLYPVGSIYVNAVNNTNPGSLLGFGTWAAFGAGRVMVGFNASNALFDTAEETGGSADAIVVSHTHDGTTSSSGSHSHFIANTDNTSASTSPSLSSTNYLTRGGGGGGTSEAYQLQGSATAPTVGLTNSVSDHTHTFTTDSEGASGTNANYQPYITVYMWKRTA